MKRLRDRSSYSHVDCGKILRQDIPERYREKHAGVHVSLAVDREMGEPSHHAIRLFRRLSESNMADEGMVLEFPRRVSPEREVHDSVPVVPSQPCVVAPGGKLSAGPRLERLDQTDVETLDEVERSPEIARSYRLTGYAQIGAGEDTGEGRNVSQDSAYLCCNVQQRDERGNREGPIPRTGQRRLVYARREECRYNSAQQAC